MAKCRRCGLKTALEDEDIAKMVESVKRSGMRLADDAEYARRLAACAQCDRLMYGSTCMVCGAVVQARCLTQRGKCPDPRGARW